MKIAYSLQSMGCHNGNTVADIYALEYKKPYIIVPASNIMNIDQWHTLIYDGSVFYFSLRVPSYI